MCPTSVFIPVPVTIAVAFPPVTEVEERIIFFCPKCREFFKYNRCVFFGVYRFTGKRGFVCCEVVRCDKTAVCGNKIACRYYKYITGNNVRGRNIKLIAVSEYTGMG